MRLLKANEVELRVAQITQTKYGVYVNLLVYKDARVDMKVLDELYGPLGWQRHHKEINGRLYCTIAVWDEKKDRWVEREDVGTESYTEKEKGQASDSFKRAGFNFGIGRELYDAPRLRFKLNDGEYYEKNGKIQSYAKFRVAEMEYNEELGEFTKFTVVDENGQIRFANNKSVNTSYNAQNHAVQQEQQQVNTNTQAQQEKEPERVIPDVWVKPFKGRMCVYLDGIHKWEYLENIQNGATLAIIATDAQGKYAQVKEQARKMLAELTAKKKGAA